MAGILYFAYGSNLLRERLLARCPNLAYAGRATLRDHRLTFDKVSTDGSGKCAYELAQGAELRGVLWNVPEKDLPALDSAEAAGQGYERRTVDGVMEDGQIAGAMAYGATRCQTGLQPYDWYLALVIAGATQQGLPDAYIERLRATPFAADTNLHRPTRCDALDALARAGLMGEFDALAH
jgi:hypothetical protein